MKKITKEILNESASKLMFNLTDIEAYTLLEEFNVIAEQMALIGKIKGVDEVSPMTFPFDVTVDTLREDTATTPLEKDVALKNASDVVDGQIRLPKVVG